MAALLLAAAMLAVAVAFPLENGVVSTATARAETDAALSVSVLELQAELAQAEEALAASEGRVLDETVRESLQLHIATASSIERTAQLREVLAGSLMGAASVEALTPETLDTLRGGVASVLESVEAWEAEQARLAELARIAAEQEAARLAAEAAASAAARSTSAVRSTSSGSAQGGAAAAAPQQHVEGIWTTGGQAEIDACKGSVNMGAVAAYLGASFYAAEHWGCGGSAWGKIGVGSRVTFSGYGVYEVVNVTGGLAAGTLASAIPSGYDAYYQTCMGGNTNNLHIWMLTKVG